MFPLSIRTVQARFRLSSPLCPTWASVRAPSRPSYYSCLFPVTLSVTIFQTVTAFTIASANEFSSNAFF